MLVDGSVSLRGKKSIHVVFLEATPLIGTSTHAILE